MSIQQYKLVRVSTNKAIRCETKPMLTDDEVDDFNKDLKDIDMQWVPVKRSKL